MKTKLTSVAIPGACLALLCATSVTLRATTITVTSTADSGPGTLRQALASAGNGDTIDAFGVSGTILLTSGELLVSNSVTIIGPGPANLKVDGNATGRVFHITNAVTTAILSLTVTNGSATSNTFPAWRGGGILNDRSILTVSNCMISGNSAGLGGGIFSEVSGGSATVSVSATTFSGNSAGLGGGIYNGGLYTGRATVSVSASTFSGNSAGDGGGIYNSAFAAGSATLSVSDSTFSGNSASDRGGGISSSSPCCEWRGYATVSVSASTFSGNSADTRGGGILNYNSTLTVSASTFSGNSAQWGGGIYNNGYPYIGGGAWVSVSASTFSGNTASYEGGGIYNNGSFGIAWVSVTASTFSGNSADLGGGIYNDGHAGYATFEIGDTILKAGSSGTNICNYMATVTSFGYNLSSDDGGGVLTNATDRINTDPMLGPLQDNGGPTFTHALLCGSPAIDAGDPSFTPPPDFDQRGPGFPRVVNGRIDIGAFELQVGVCNPPVAKCKNVVVAADASCTASASIDDGSFDPDMGDTITVVQSPAGPYPVGDTAVTLTVTDNHGASASCTATVTVVDNTPPTITDVAVTPNNLRVPNHKMVLVTVDYAVADNCGVADYALSASSSEPEDGLGDGATANDIQLIPDDPYHLYLRAERSGTGDGRIYTITIACTDTSGNTATHSAQVTVAHDKRSNGRGNRIDAAPPGEPKENAGPGTGPGTPGDKPVRP